MLVLAVLGLFHLLAGWLQLGSSEILLYKIGGWNHVASGAVMMLASAGQAISVFCSQVQDVDKWR